MHNDLESVFNKFQVHATFSSVEELISGHINDTYLIKTAQKPHYVLQKINGVVFPDALELIQNKVLVSNHLQHKYKHLSLQEIQRKVLCFVKAKDNTFFYKDTDDNYWNVTIFIDDSITYEKTPNSQIAFEAGKITGEFLQLTKDFDTKNLTTILPDFHSVTNRYHQFKNAINTADESKIESAQEFIKFVEEHIKEMQQIDAAIFANKIPQQLTHSDTKISNILYTKTNEALCLIDTDTVMQGVIHFDYGDALRTICNTTDEDCNVESEIDFNLDYFKSYSKGFFGEIKDLTKVEIKFLPLSIKMMPFIMGLRFLTDYLNNNIYYKTNYEKHNFDRAINQLTLVAKIIQKYSEINTFLLSELKN